MLGATSVKRVKTTNINHRHIDKHKQITNNTSCINKVKQTSHIDCSGVARGLLMSLAIFFVHKEPPNPRCLEPRELLAPLQPQPLQPLQLLGRLQLLPLHLRTTQVPGLGKVWKSTERRFRMVRVWVG